MTSGYYLQSRCRFIRGTYSPTFRQCTKHVLLGLGGTKVLVLFFLSSRSTRNLHETRKKEREKKKREEEEEKRERRRAPRENTEEAFVLNDLGAKALRLRREREREREREYIESRGGLPCLFRWWWRKGKRMLVL